MRVALFGGSFNPPHVGHQLLALYVLETAPIDELWLVPTFQHAFDKPLVSFQDRCRMCLLAVQALGPRVRVSDVEAQLGGPSQTLRTVERLRLDHPDTAFSVVIGADLRGEVDTWFQAETLRRTVPFIEVGRAGQQIAGVAMPAISSTEIRAALAAGRDTAAWVPKTVLDYITSLGLYGSPQTMRGTVRKTT